MRIQKQLSSNLRQFFIRFMYYYANGTLPFFVGHHILGGDLDYMEKLEKHYV